MTGSTLSRAPQLGGLALATALAVSGLAGCAEDTQTVTEDVYCATADGTIVDPDLCDRDGDSGSYFIWIGSYGGSHHRPGHRLSGGSSFRYNDQAKRKSYGLPATGRPMGTGGVGGKITRTTTTKGGSYGGSGSSASKGGGVGGKSGGFGG